MNRFLLTGVALLTGSLFALLPLATTAADRDRPVYREVQDLQYGVILYHFFQQSYFDALTETLIGEQRNDLPHHLQSAELLRGGMSLSYGMAPQAEAIFKKSLSESRSEAERDKAWFYLGKLNYLRGDRQAARDIFERIGSSLPKSLQQEFLYLKANLKLESGDTDAADELISDLPDTSHWLAYYYFNRGAALTRSGQWSRGVDSFAQVTELDTEDEEGLALRDRAFTASGFARLGGGDLDGAIADFLQVRLESPQVEKAMLGYGWAAAKQSDFRKALSPWQALAKKSLLDPSVQESLLAIPYAYEKLDARASALEEYQYAVHVFENELYRVDQAIEAFDSQPIVELVTDGQGLNSDWIAGEDYLPVNPHVPYLRHLIAQDHFQLLVNDLGDMVQINRHLFAARQRLDAIGVVLADQQTLWEESLNTSHRDQYRQQYQRLKALREQLQRERIIADREADGRRFVSEEEAELWRIAEHARVVIEQLQAGGEDVRHEANQLRVMRGLLLWQASEQDSARRWAFTKQLREIERLLQETDQRLQRLEALTEDRYDEQYADRLQALRTRIDAQSQQAATILLGIEDRVRQLAIADLSAQKQRLSYYLGQAKLSIARLYDTGSREQEQ